MARRYSGNMNGERYLGNRNKMELHDLDNEQTGPNGCQIDEIIAAGHDVPFNSPQEAKAAGFDRGHYCLGGSLR